MGGIRKPTSDAALQRLCELHSELEGRIAYVEEARDAVIAKINASTDETLAPFVAELERVREKIEPYFMAQRARLLPKNRKSMELGGCELGSRSGKDRLSISGKAADVAKELVGKRWAKALIKRTPSLDIAAVFKALSGPRGDDLRAMGFGVQKGEETFFIKRTEQSGTSGKTRAST